MKRVISFLTLLALSLLFCESSRGLAQGNQDKLDSFRQNLLKNLSSDNHGVRESALQLLNQYSEALGFRSDVGDQSIWEAFRDNLEANLASSNYGVRQSAMQLVCQYGDRLNLDRAAIFSLMRIYRLEKDIRYRQMALAALHKTRDEWAMGFLKSNLAFEDDPRLKQMISAIVLDYEAEGTGS